jgi:hypothetical protein
LNQTIKINSNNQIIATDSNTPSSDKKISDSTIRALLSQEEMNSSSSNTVSTNIDGSNTRFIRIPDKQLVTIVPVKDTSRNQIVTNIRQNVLSGSQDERGFNVIPDLNQSNITNSSSNVLVTQQVKIYFL